MNSSISEPIISDGRLSTQKYPSSSNAAIAVDLPAPENPVITTRSVRADASMVQSLTGCADERRHGRRKGVPRLGREPPRHSGGLRTLALRVGAGAGPAASYRGRRAARR